MREKRWLLLALYGIALASAVSGALRATRPKFKIAQPSTTTTSTTTEEPRDENEDAESPATTVAAETNATNGHTLTGIPQIDYIWDPNLPRELNGYNLSEYPFYNSIPEDIDFKCDGLHDGFYASVPHKCQVYHHCLFGTRYDFLCANFTAFDQKTFICHFVSEVDCANSKKYWHRNDALYKAATTSTSTTTTTTTTTLAPPVTAATGRAGSRDRDPPRRRRPLRRRPSYDYYDEEYYDDEYGRPRGYGRDDYEYEDRKYRRDRDREFRERDRDFRERDSPRSRDDRDRETVRERYPSRSNRRDPARPRDPIEEDTRVRGREPDQGGRSASREIDDAELDDRRGDSRPRDRFRDDYDDKEPSQGQPVTIANTEGLVKPAAPISSVYARPRAPPKIRRPVPLSEQDRYAYKATSVQPTEEPRRRPVDVPEDDYYEDELDDPRPIRRPLRRRPAYRERDRDFYDARDRERERDRPFRPRYREDEDDARPRKHPDRSRDRFYDRERERAGDRGRDRSLDRGKDRTPERTTDRDRGRAQDAERQERPYAGRPVDRERDLDRPRTASRSKDLSDPGDSPRRSNAYDRTSERTTTPTTSTTSTATTTTCLPEQLIPRKEIDLKESMGDRSERPIHERPTRPVQSPPSRPPIDERDPSRDHFEKSHRTPPPPPQPDYHERDELHEQNYQYHSTSSEEYPQEYYDEPEEPPAPPPRTAVRIVKRPFLPSRGGNPNPRGLSSVGSKALPPRREEDDETTDRGSLQERPKSYYVHDNPRETYRDSGQDKPRTEEKQSYDAYKTVQSNIQQERRTEELEASLARPAVRRPIDRQREEETKSTDDEKHGTSEDRERSKEEALKWVDEYPEDRDHEENVQTSPNPTLRQKGRLTNETPNIYTSTYKTEENHEQPTGPGSYRIKQRINEVTHRLQDIPESEYDVTLNDALTPTLNQEASLPSGFVLPLHRQVGRDTNIQSTETSYKLSRPINPQQQQQQQQQQLQQQKPFVPSPQFLPTVGSNDRVRAVYYRSPETIQISGAQYRQQRGPWHDYTGY